MGPAAAPLSLSGRKRRRLSLRKVRSPLSLSLASRGKFRASLISGVEEEGPTSGISGFSLFSLRHRGRGASTVVVAT